MQQYPGMRIKFSSYDGSQSGLATVLYISRAPAGNLWFRIALDSNPADDFWAATGEVKCVHDDCVESWEMTTACAETACEVRA